MLSLFHAELKKAHRRHDLLIIVMIAAAVVILSMGNSRNEPDTGYSALFYAIPIMNALILSTGMAVLANRIWDVETKGNTCKLLFTLQSRSSLYIAKAVLGVLEVALVCILECLALIAFGILKGYTEPLDLSRLFWLFLCTFLVSLLLFFFSYALCLYFPSQVPALAVGLAGSLIGLFSGFMPKIVTYFVPWGYFIPLSAMEMGWNPETRDIWYIPQPFPGTLLLVSAIFIIVLLTAGYSLMQKKEV
ncbi:MAG: ABC transporter permease [Eubacteriales bacterium]|nr:ABC transporter permease [Eubacteriales bacterium]